MGDAKVQRIKQNLDRVVLNSIELLCEALEQLPPHRPQKRTYEIVLTATIKESDTEGNVVDECKIRYVANTTDSRTG